MTQLESCVVLSGYSDFKITTQRRMRAVEWKARILLVEKLGAFRKRRWR